MFHPIRAESPILGRPELIRMYLRYREPAWDGSDAAEVLGFRGTASRDPSPKNEPGSAAPPAVLRSPELVRTLPVIELNHVKLHAVTESQVVAHILAELEAGRGGVVVTPNLDHLRRYCRDLSFGALIAEADLVVADGMPLVWASRLQGTPLPERVPGSNLISSLTASAARRARSVFLLGGDPGTAEGAARALNQRYSHALIAGTHFPPFGFEDSPKEMSTIIQKLTDAKPDIVFVALGSPKQEKLIARLRPILPNAWWMGVGNSFSFLAGHVRRAPLWMQRTGLEWMHRLGQEPRRLFKRYLIVGIPFAGSLLTRSLIRGVPNRVRRFRVEGAAPMVSEDIPTRDSAEKLRNKETADTLHVAGELRPPRPSPASAAPGVHSDPLSLSPLRAMVLLGGSVRATALSAATHRSVLDLPLDASGTLLNHWLNHAGELARWAALDHLPVRVMVTQNASEPRSAESSSGHLRVERDLSDYRGTGGVLRDVAADYDDDDVILVANAAQVLLDPLPAIASALQRKGGEIGLISHDDGTPSGIMLITCKTLRLIPPRGFVDMKEQALPLIASKHVVRVMRRARPTGLPVRSLSDYIQALRLHHRRKSGRPGAADPLAEDWSPTFSLIEPGASVDHSARVHDSVVLRGARVEAGAVLVRSIVCPQAVVYRDHTAVDELVVGTGPKARRRKARSPELQETGGKQQF